MAHVLQDALVPAPALTRGLRLLELLAVEGQASLEQLANKSGWPKSSVRRCLQAMEAIEAVRRDPTTKTWKAVKRLQPIDATSSPSLDAAKRVLPALAHKLAHCAELYATAPNQVELIDRAEPDLEDIAIVAKVGYARDLSELDATSALFHACGSASPSPPAKAWQWSNGQVARRSKAQAAKILDAARKDRYAIDNDFNSNGIRRFASPIFEESKTLVGILAIAQRLTPSSKSETDFILQTLTQTAHSLEQS